MKELEAILITLIFIEGVWQFVVQDYWLAFVFLGVAALAYIVRTIEEEEIA